MGDSFNVCSYNMGAQGDYEGNVLSAQDKSILGNDQGSFTTRYKKIQETFSKKMTGMADVFCFQEVAAKAGMDRELSGGLTAESIAQCRPEMRALTNAEGKNFKFFFAGSEKGSFYENIAGKKTSTTNRARETVDTVIAIDTNRFDVAPDGNKSFVDNTNDVAIVIATEKKSGKRILFATAHIPGAHTDAIGDAHCQKVIKKINAISSENGCTHVVFGGDLNADRVKESDTRHKMFEETGFNLEGAGKITSTHSKFGDKEIDYIATRDEKRYKKDVETKKSVGEQIAHFFSSKRMKTKVLREMTTDKFDSSEDVSDHKAVVMQIKIASRIDPLKKAIQAITEKPQMLLESLAKRISKPKE